MILTCETSPIIVVLFYVIYSKKGVMRVITQDTFQFPNRVLSIAGQTGQHGPRAATPSPARPTSTNPPRRAKLGTAS